MHSLDTSFFMDWQARYYPLDLFTSLEKKIAALIASGSCAAVQLVKEEIDAVGTPGLRGWVAQQPGLFLPLSPEVQIKAAAIEASYPELMDPKGLNESADAYVIALAKLQKNGIVVSQETSVQEKHRPRRSYFIPDVCRDLGLPCINLLGMMRREKWTF